ncbi:hypothetical protein [Paraflavitalea sp. sgz302552]|uniref:hypothetical protein n=1 Tax=Paraflavitalea sp. sgz302552 TaxID=3423908 RepID=UPI003D33A928
MAGILLHSIKPIPKLASGGIGAIGHQHPERRATSNSKNYTKAQSIVNSNNYKNAFVFHDN